MIYPRWKNQLALVPVSCLQSLTQFWGLNMVVRRSALCGWRTGTCLGGLSTASPRSLPLVLTSLLCRKPSSLLCRLRTLPLLCAGQAVLFIMALLVLYAEPQGMVTALESEF